jgi:hypothetical protein
MQGDTMAQKVNIQLVDDISGEEAQETVRFSLDGANYEIDLTTDNAAKLRDALSTYVENGRKAQGRGPGQPRGTSTASKTTGDREELQKIRQWAQENGHNVNSRGRISSEIRNAYNAAN